MSDIELIITSKEKSLGDTFTVRRALPVAQKRMIGPFIFFDHMGPVELEIGHGMDVRPHPHIGLSTLTYLFDGEALHRDTLGFEQLIQPGAVNWMTAGRGVAHSERTPEHLRSARRRLHGIQIWIALPKEKEEMKPTFHHHPAQTIPESDGVRVIAGRYNGLVSPVEVHSELTYLDVRLKKNQVFEFIPNGYDLGVYIVSGQALVNNANTSAGQLAVLTKNKFPRIQAQTDCTLLVLGGKPFAEPRHIWWNFVSSSQERIEQAKIEWTNQAFGKIKGEDEFVPLPRS